MAALYDERQSLDAETITEEYVEFGRILKPFLCDVAMELAQRIHDGQRVLFEGAQGTLLDIDHGTYPFVTSSSTGVGGGLRRCGRAARGDRFRVGGGQGIHDPGGRGPHADRAERRRRRGHSRPRTRVWNDHRPAATLWAWFDAVATRYAATISGARCLSLMHLDTLSGFDEIKICISYRHGSQTLNTLPGDAYTLAEVEPVYETRPGWTENLSACRKWDDLPAAARAYAERLGECVGAPVQVLSVGPEREQTIVRDLGN